MKKKFISLAVILAAGLFFLKRNKDFSFIASENLKEPLQVSAPRSVSSVKVSAAATPAPSEFKNQFHREVFLSSRIDEHPEESERRLDFLAAKLSPEEQKFLKNLVLDPKAGGDERAVAEEILGRSHSSPPSVLEEIASHEGTDWKDPQRNDFERALRARAIEQLGIHPSPAAEDSLKNLTQRLQDSFLVDRAQRALLARSGQVPSPEAQDNEAFQKVLTSSGPKPHH